MKPLTLIVTLVFVTFSMAGDLKCAGCKTEYFLIKDLAKGYAEAHGGAKVLPGKLGNKKAVFLLLEGKIDFAFCCKPFPKLLKKFKLNPDLANKYSQIRIAKDPVVLVSNRKNGIKNLSMDQLKKVLSGHIKNWKEIGGTDVPIIVIHLNDELVESGVFTVFMESTIGAKAHISANSKKVSDPQKVGVLTSQTPGAICFMGLNSFKGTYGELVQIDNITPSINSVQDGSYKITASYYLIFDNAKSAQWAPFEAFVKSEKGKKIISSSMVVDF